MARKLGSPSLSRLRVSRDLEIENKATITGLGLGLVAEMNQVELGLVAEMNLVEHGLVAAMNLVELGLVAAMNLVELGLVADIFCRWTHIGVMAADR